MSVVGTSTIQFDVDLSAANKKIDQLEARIAKAKQGAGAAGSGGASGGGGVSSQNAALQQTANHASAAERQILALARAQATNAQAAGDGARAEQILQAALARVDTTTVEAINLSTKLLQVQNRLSNSKGPTVLPRTIDGLSGSALNLAKSYLTIQAAERGFQFIKTGAEVADVTRSFDSLSKAAGTTGETLLGSLRAASNGTIADATLIKSANLGLLLTQGQIAKSLPQLTQIAQASAKATGQSVDFVFESLVKGIARGSAKIIDNAGITLDGEAAFSAYAQSIGKTADELTKAEQQQAVTNAVLKTGAQIVKDVGINAEDSSVKIAQAQTAIENLGTAIGAKIAPFAGTIAGAVANKLNTGNTTPDTEAAGTQVQGGLISHAASYETYAKSIRTTNDSIRAAFADDPVAGALAVRLHGLEALNPVEFAYAQSLIQTGTAYQTAITKAQALGNVSDSLTQQTQGQSAAFTNLIPKMAAVSAMSTSSASDVLALNAAYLQNQVSVDQVNTVLTALIAVQDQAQQAAFQEARENRNLTRSFDAIVPSANAAQAAIAGVAGAAPETRHIGGLGQAVGGLGDLLTKGFVKTADASAAADSEAQKLLDSEIALAGAKQNTARQIELLRQKQAQYTKGSAEYNNIQAQIIGVQNSAAKAGASGLAGLLQSEIDLQDNLVDKLHAVQDALTHKGLKQAEINKLLKEEKDLQAQLQDAALNADVSAIEDRQARRQETKQLDFLDRLAQAGGDRGAQAADHAQLIRDRAAIRTRALNKQITEAGGVAPQLGTIPLTPPPPTTGGDQQSTAAAAAAGGGVSIGTLNNTLVVGEDVIAAAIQHNVQNNSRAALRTNRATG